MKKILIADDQRDVVRILEIKLTAAGYTVISADNGVDCLKLIYEEEPDLAILDICMPRLDGNEVAAKLKKDPKFKHLPVIFLTALLSKEDEQTQGSTIADNTIFAKPFDPNKVLAKIQGMIGT